MSQIGLGEIRSAEAWRASLAEFLGTLLFVFIGAGSVAVTGQVIGDDLTSARLITIALAHGLAIILLVTAIGHLSGGHINPVVTLAALIMRKITLVKGAMYIAMQLLGAIVGALLLKAVIPVSGTLGSHGLGAGVDPGVGLLVEVVLTFLLVFVIISAAMDSRGMASIAPLAIGLAVVVDHIVGVPLTGASMNPARSLGPALVSGTWGDHWIYWAGPAIGAAAAAFGYLYIFMPGKGKK